MLNIPIIGDYIADIVDIVEKNRWIVICVKKLQNILQIL
jgi:hypothetical protein